MAGNDFALFLDKICREAIESSFTCSGSVCEVQEIKGSQEYTEYQSTIAITISSHRFRNIMTLCFSDNEILNRYVAQKTGVSNSESLGQEQRNDFLSELANTIAGDMKRKLQEQVFSLGMSTPCILECRSLAFVESLNVDHQLHLSGFLNGTPIIGVSFHTSIYQEVDVDFTITFEGIEGGGLELF